MQCKQLRHFTDKIAGYGNCDTASLLSDKMLFLTWVALFFLCPSYTLYLCYYYLIFIPVSGYRLWKKKAWQYNQNASIFLLYAILAYGVISLIPDIINSPAICLDMLKKTIFSLLFFMSAVDFFRDKSNENYFWKRSLHIVGLGAVLSLAVFFILHPQERLLPLAQAHNIILGASVYGLYGLFMLNMFFTAQKKSKGIIFTFFCAVLLLIVLTQSKGALISVFISYVALSVLQLRNQGRLYALMLMLVVFGIVWFLYVCGNPEIVSYVARFEQRGLSYRPQIWEYALHEIQNNIIFGHGLAATFYYRVDEYIEAGHSHSLYLAMLYNLGVIGFTLLILFFLRVIKNICCDKDVKWKNLALCVMLYLLLSISSDVARLISNPKELVMLIWLPLAWLIARDLNHSSSLKKL